MNWKSFIAVFALSSVVLVNAKPKAKGWTYRQPEVTRRIFEAVNKLKGSEPLWALIEGTNRASGEVWRIENEKLEKNYEWRLVYEPGKLFGFSAKKYKDAVSRIKQIQVIVFDKLNAAEVYIVARFPGSDEGKFFSVSYNEELGTQGSAIFAKRECQFFDDMDGPHFKINDDDFKAEYSLQNGKLVGDGTEPVTLRSLAVYELKGLIME